MGPVTCGPPRDFEMGQDGDWDAECRFDNGAGASVLIRFNGNHVTKSEIIA